MKIKNSIATFVAAIVSLAAVSPMSAEVFKSGYSTYGVHDDDAGYELLTGMLIGSGVARHPVGTRIDEASPAQVGIFSNLVAKAVPAFTNGVILSTGKIIANMVDGVAWPTNTQSTFEATEDSVQWGHGTDSDLDGYFDDVFYDPAGIVLFVQPSHETINIPFLMASEEFYYPFHVSDTPGPDLPTLEEYGVKSDKFAFFLKELGRKEDVLDSENKVKAEYRDVSMATNAAETLWWNIAQLPGGGSVEIATVNQHTNTEYFISNVSNENGNLVFPAGDINLPMEFNGAIVGPVAVAEGLDTNKIYKLKIIIGDMDDDYVNSTVFLRERGITSGADLKVEVDGPSTLTTAGTATFTDTVSNIGPASANGVKVKHYLPEGVDTGTVIVDCGGVGSVGVIFQENGTNCFVWTIGDGFKSGSNAVMTVSCALPDVGSYTNVAVVATSTGDYDEKNNVDYHVATVMDAFRLRVEAISTSKVYGAELALSDLQFILSIDGTNETQIVSGVDVAFTNALGEVADPTVANAAVGTYGIVLSNIRGFDLSPFGGRITYVPGVLTIEKSAITITANDATKAYGDAVTFAGAEFAITSGALAAGDSVASVALASDGAAANAPYVVGGYPIVPSAAVGTGLANYDITYANGTLTITKRAITITANDATKAYGDAVTFAGTEFAITSGALAAGDEIESVSLTSAGAVADAAPGDYSITASDATGTGLDNYEIMYVDGTLKVTKRAITITANDATKTYGDIVTFAGAEFAITSGTLAAGDTVDSVTLTSDGAAANAPYVAGGYPIVPSAATGTGLANYDISYVNGTLTVTKRAITITANDATKTYGDELTFAGTEFAVTAGALAVGDAVASVTLTSDGAAANASAGSHTIVPSAAVGTGLANYDISYVNGMLTVTKLTITIKANDATKAYGDTLAFVGTEFTLASGTLATGDMVDSVTLTSAGTAATAAAGVYPIVPSAATGTGLANYVITYVNGTLTVNKRVLTITANDATKAYGDAVTFAGTEFAITSGTLAADDSVDFVTLTSDGAAATAAIGTYSIAASDARGTGIENYDIVYADGTLTVTTRKITISANDATKEYGEERAFAGTEFAVTSGALAAGDSVDSVTLTSDGAAANASAGSYPIVPSSAIGTGLEKYDITYVDGTLTVAKFAVTITANDATKAYGEELTFDGTEFTVSEELPNGDQVASVVITSEKAAEPGTEVGEYADEIVPFYEVTGIDTNNYDIVFSNGTLTVTQAVLTIAVNNAEWQVGKPRPTYSFADFSAQLKAGDTMAAVTGGSGLATDVEYTNAVWSASEPTGADVGTYADEIWLDLASVDGTRAANYAIMVAPGDLEVTDPAEPLLKTSLSARLNWNTGLLDLELTVSNEGDGEVDSSSDYWVQLKPGDAGSGAIATVEKTYYIVSPTGTMANGCDYVDITSAVKAALRAVGNGDEVFNPGEAVTVNGVSVYHWKRWSPEKFIVADDFFAAGRLGDFAEGDKLSTRPDAGEAVGAHVLTSEGKPTRNDQTARSCMFPAGVETLGEFSAHGAATYNGWLRDSSGRLAALLKVVTAAARKDGSPVRSVITVTPFDGSRKRTYRTTILPGGNPTDEFGVIYGSLGLAGELEGCAVVAARDFAKAKPGTPERELVQFMPLGAWVLAIDDAVGYSVFSVAVSNGGKAKIAGTLSDGGKVTISAQGVLGEGGVFAVPVMNAKKGIAFVIWIDEAGELNVSDAAVAEWSLAAYGTPQNLADGVHPLVFDLPKWRNYMNGVDGAAEENAVVVANGRWKGSNGMRISYDVRRGTAKGSFKLLYEDSGRVRSDTVSIFGVVVSGRLYATATVRKLGSFKVTTDE